MTVVVILGVAVRVGEGVVFQLASYVGRHGSAGQNLLLSLFCLQRVLLQYPYSEGVEALLSKVDFRVLEMMTSLLNFRSV